MTVTTPTGKFPKLRPCKVCSRTMRPGGSRTADYPGTIGYGREGACDSCTRAADRGTLDTHRIHRTRDWMKPGITVTLTRWQHTRDGWTLDTVTGTWAGETRRRWILTIDGAEAGFDRDEWTVTLP